MPAIDDTAVQEMIERLSGLPSEEARDFELRITRIANSGNRPQTKVVLEHILDGEESPHIRYAAFYSLHILLRRSKDFTLLDEFVTRWSTEFSGHPTFSHLTVMLATERGLGRDRDEIINQAYENYVRFPRHAGIVHMFPTVVATVCEDANETTLPALRDEWLGNAIQAVDQAIRLNGDYAKFYCTKARLLAIDGQFDESLRFIKVAIDNEDSSKNDYAIRLGDYQYYRLLIQARRSQQLVAADMEQSVTQLEKRQEEAAELVEEAMEQVKDAKSQLDGSMTKNLEFLGFFAALVSFTIGSIQVAVSFQPDSAARLIVILMGALLAAYSGFVFVLERNNGVKLWKIGIVFGFSLLVITGAIIKWF